eukprot:77860-Pleurochrysis_carterae.AAC.1
MMDEARTKRNPIQYLIHESIVNRSSIVRDEEAMHVYIVYSKITSQHDADEILVGKSIFENSTCRQKYRRICNFVSLYYAAACPWGPMAQGQEPNVYRSCRLDCGQRRVRATD